MSQAGLSNQQQNIPLSSGIQNDQQQKHASAPQLGKGSEPEHHLSDAEIVYGLEPEHHIPWKDKDYSQKDAGGARPQYPAPSTTAHFHQGPARHDNSSTSDPNSSGQTVYVVPSVSSYSYPPHNPVYISQGDEEAGAKGLDFSVTSIRQGFIRKVFSIVFIQLAITLGFIAFFIYCQPAEEWVLQTGWPLILGAIVVVFVCLIILMCCGDLRRKPPTNYIFLFILTIAQAFCVGVVAAVFEPETVLMAVAATAIVCTAIIIFAFQTKWDFTYCNSIMFVTLFIILIFGGSAIFMYNRIFPVLYASIFAFIFCIYIIIDVQMLMGGKRRFTISPEEYIFAALILYLDILNLFLQLLRIFSYFR